MEPGTLLLLAVGCALSCVVIFVLGTVLNMLGVVFEVLGSILELLAGLFNFGPVPGCGCLLLVFAIISCVGGVTLFNSIVSTCDTASRMLFCSWIGR